MNRWIDAKWLKNRVHDVLLANGAVHGCVDKLDLIEAPSIDIVRCGECKHYKLKGACMRLDRRMLAVRPDDFCSYGSRSEKPNNCEHITEDGVTCAKYPACDDCLDNPLNKVKGSERLLKGSEIPNNCEPKICDTCRYYNSNIPCGSTPSACKEADKFAKEFVDGLKKLKQTVPTISKMEQVDKDINVRSKDEPQTERSK